MPARVIRRIKQSVSPKTRNIAATGGRHQLKAFVEIATGASGIVDAFRTAPHELLGLDEVKRLYVITGEYDVLVDIESSDMFSLTSLLKRINGFAWVKKMRTSIVESVDKYTKIYTKGGRELDDKALLTESLIAFVGIDVREGTESKVIERLEPVPEIKKLYHVTGTHDVLAVLVCENMWSLSKVFDRILEGPFVVSTVTEFVVKIYKH